VRAGVTQYHAAATSAVIALGAQIVPHVVWILAIIVTFNSAASAEQPPLSSCDPAEYRQLDFWLGDWDTFESDDPSTSIARAQVTRIADGCALHERYEQSDGLIGESILSFDAVRKQWQQTWVTNRGSLMVISGGFRDGVLTMEGNVHLRDGRTVLQRITWRVEGRDVRETAVMSTNEGRTWEPAFDVIFRRRS
jgi:hypothetical protein